MILILGIGVIDDARDFAKISWDSMSPPELSTDAPILNLFKPVKPCLFVLFRNDKKVLTSDSITRSFGKIFTVNVPLRLKEGLDNIS